MTTVVAKTAHEGLELAQRKPTVTLICTDKNNFLFRQVESWLWSERECPVELFGSFREFIATAKHDHKSLVLLNLDSPVAFQEIGQSLAQFFNKGLHWSCQIMVVNFLDHPKIQPFFKQYGCVVMSVFLSFPLKALKHKIDHYLKLLDASVGEAPEFITQFSSEVISSPPVKVVWQQPLMLKSDFWLLPMERFIFKTYAKWMIVMLGPGPSAGHWAKVVNPTNVQLRAGEWWEWKPQHREGRWFFEGRKPQFQGSRWFFFSERPELVFVKEEGSVFQKLLCTSDSSIDVAANSSFSVALLPNIKKTVGSKPVKTRALGKKSIFMALDDDGEIDKVFEETVFLKKSVTVWIRSKAKVLRGHVKYFKDSDATNGDGKRVTLEVGESSRVTEFLNVFHEDSRPQCLANIQLPQGMVFFILRKIEKTENGGGLVFTPRKPLFYVQRRKNIRMPVKLKMPLRLLFGEIPYRLIEIGTGGLSFLVNQKDLEDTDKFKAGAPIQFYLDIKGESVRCDGELRWVKGSKVGLKFTNLTAKAAQMIYFFIFEQAS